MTTHIGLMALFAFFVSVTFATLMRDDPRHQAALALRLFGAFMLGGIVFGWVLYPLPL